MSRPCQGSAHGECAHFVAICLAEREARGVEVPSEAVPDAVVDRVTA
jgi:hypothetical protein